VCGCAIGTAASAALPPDAGIAGYVAGLAEGAGADFGERFFSALLRTGRYHAAALFFAFSALGVVCVPALTAWRGFLLCFAMSSITRCGGPAGFPAALAIFAPEALVAVPCLFLLSARSFASSLALLRAASRNSVKTAPAYGGLAAICGVCALALAASSLISASLAPAMLSRLAGR
jgi:hypothetical protein